MADRAREACLRAVRLLSRFYYYSDPSTLTEEQVKDYMLWTRHPRRAASRTLEIMGCYSETTSDLALEQWWPPVLTRTPDNGLCCPICDHPLQFESSTRIRPPPREFRGCSLDHTNTRFEPLQN